MSLKVEERTGKAVRGRTLLRVAGFEEEGDLQARDAGSSWKLEKIRKGTSPAPPGAYRKQRALPTS